MENEIAQHNQQVREVWATLRWHLARHAVPGCSQSILGDRHGTVANLPVRVRNHAVQDRESYDTDRQSDYRHLVQSGVYQINRGLDKP